MDPTTARLLDDLKDGDRGALSGRFEIGASTGPAGGVLALRARRQTLLGQRRQYIRRRRVL